MSEAAWIYLGSLVASLVGFAVAIITLRNTATADALKALKDVVESLRKENLELTKENARLNIENDRLRQKAYEAGASE